MTKLEEMRSKLTGLVEQADGITAKADSESRSLTDEERALLDKVLTEANDLQKEIKIADADEARRRQIKALQGTEPSGPTAGRMDPQATGAKPEKLWATPRRTRQLRAFSGPDAEDRAYEFGMWVKGTIGKDDDAWRWCRDRGVVREDRALSSLSNSAGGFLVPVAFSNRIIDLRSNYGIVRRNADIWPMSDPVQNVPAARGNLTAYWVAEGQEVTDSTPTFGNVQLVAKKLAVRAKTPNELLADSVIDLADWLMDNASYALAIAEDTAVFAGTGLSTHGGISGLRTQMTEALGLAGAVLVSTTTHDLFSEIDADDLAKLMGTLHPAAQANAKFYISHFGKAYVFDANSISLGGTPGSEIAAGFKPSYLGYPIVACPNDILPSTNAAQDGTAMFFFGDMKQTVTVGDYGGIAMAVDSSQYFSSDITQIKVTERVDLNIHDLGTTSVAGSMVAMVGSTS